MNTQRIKIQALSDQVWRAADEHLDDLKRIAQFGAQTECDVAILQMALATIIGEVHKRRAENE